MLLAFLLPFLALSFQFSASPPLPTRAQSDNPATCEALITQAVQQIGSACRELGKNEVCYGNTLVSATLSDRSLKFADAGDIVSVADLEAIVTRAADPESGTWGIALMDLQADLPASEDDSLRLVMFGGVEVTPAVPATPADLPTCTFTNTGSGSLNLRTGPGTHYRIVDILDRNRSLEVYGQSHDGNWLRSARGWIYRPMGALTCNGAPLTIFDDVTDAYASPMQSFTMQINDEGQCAAAPPGLLVQVPAGQTANILVNNVEIRLGSTAFLTMTPADEMVIANLQGNVGVTADEITMVLPVGAQASVSISNDAPTGSPHNLEPLQGATSQLHATLLAALPTAVVLPNPFGLAAAPGNQNVSTAPDGSTRTGALDPLPPILQEGENDGWIGWGACGSCNTCGGNPGQCTTSPAGTCVLNPVLCPIDPTPDPDDPPDDPPGTPPPSGSLTVPQSHYNCVPLLTVPVTYNSPVGATIASHSASSDNLLAVSISSTVLVPPDRVNVTVVCLLLGNANITITITDSLGDTYSVSFRVG